MKSISTGLSKTGSVPAGFERLFSKFKHNSTASLKDSRKLLRLFKWSIEYKRILLMYERRPTDYTDFDLFLSKDHTNE